MSAIEDMATSIRDYAEYAALPDSFDSRWKSAIEQPPAPLATDRVAATAPAERANDLRAALDAWPAGTATTTASPGAEADATQARDEAYIRSQTRHARNIGASDVAAGLLTMTGAAFTMGGLVPVGVTLSVMGAGAGVVGAVHTERQTQEKIAHDGFDESGRPMANAAAHTSVLTNVATALTQTAPPQIQVVVGIGSMLSGLANLAHAGANSDAFAGESKPGENHSMHAAVADVVATHSAPFFAMLPPVQFAGGAAQVYKGIHELLDTFKHAA